MRMYIDKNYRNIQGYFEVGEKIPERSLRLTKKVPRKRHGLSPSSFLCLLFPLRSVNIEDPVLTVIHFSSLHSFTLFCLLSVLARHRGQTGPRRFLFFFPRRVLGSAMNYLFANIHWEEEHPRTPVNVSWFSTQSGLPSTFYPFPRENVRLELHGCCRDEPRERKKKPEEAGNALSL